MCTVELSFRQQDTSWEAVVYWVDYFIYHFSMQVHVELSFRQQETSLEAAVYCVGHFIYHFFMMV